MNMVPGKKRRNSVPAVEKKIFEVRRPSEKSDTEKEKEEEFTIGYGTTWKGALNRL